METRIRIGIIELEEFGQSEKRNYDILKMRKTTLEARTMECTCMKNGSHQPILGRMV